MVNIINNREDLLSYIESVILKYCPHMENRLAILGDAKSQEIEINLNINNNETAISFVLGDSFSKRNVPDKAIARYILSFKDISEIIDFILDDHEVINDIFICDKMFDLKFGINWTEESIKGINCGDIILRLYFEDQELENQYLYLLFQRYSSILEENPSFKIIKNGFIKMMKQLINNSLSTPELISVFAEMSEEEIKKIVYGLDEDLFKEHFVKNRHLPIFLEEPANDCEIYKIDFFDDMTIDSVIENFRLLTEEGIESYIEIDGISIYWNDENRDDKIRTVLQRHSSQEKPKNDKTENNCPKNYNEYLMSLTEFEKRKHEEKKEALSNYTDLLALSENPIFTFELGTVLQYTKRKNVREVMDYYISIYRDENSSELLRNLNYLAELAIIINLNCSDSEKRLKIQEMINRINVTDSEITKLIFAVEKIEKHIINGEQIRELLQLDILDKNMASVAEESNKVFGKKLFPYEQNN